MWLKVEFIQVEVPLISYVVSIKNNKNYIFNIHHKFIKLMLNWTIFRRIAIGEKVIQRKTTSLMNDAQKSSQRNFACIYSNPNNTSLSPSPHIGMASLVWTTPTSSSTSRFIVVPKPNRILSSDDLLFWTLSYNFQQRDTKQSQ